MFRTTKWKRTKTGWKKHMAIPRHHATDILDAYDALLEGAWDDPDNHPSDWLRTCLKHAGVKFDGEIIRIKCTGQDGQKTKLVIFVSIVHFPSTA